MKAIKSAAVIAIIAEAVLCGVYALFGKFSLTHDRDTNIIGLFTVYFHMPGIWLALRIFQTFNGAGWWFVPFIVFTGAVQFFLWAWFMIVMTRKPKERKPPDFAVTNPEAPVNPKS
jgi:hypothetical protein